MAKINIHDGDGTSDAVKRLAMRMQTDLTLDDLIDGVCSRYVEHFSENLPSSLKEAELLEVVRTEYLCHGTLGVWQWATKVPEGAADQHRTWARNLITTAIPAMKENQ